MPLCQGAFATIRAVGVATAVDDLGIRITFTAIPMAQETIVRRTEFGAATLQDLTSSGGGWESNEHES